MKEGEEVGGRRRKVRGKEVKRACVSPPLRVIHQGEEEKTVRFIIGTTFRRGKSTLCKIGRSEGVE